MRFQQQEIVVVALKKPFFLRKRGEGGGESTDIWTDGPVEIKQKL